MILRLLDHLPYLDVGEQGEAVTLNVDGTDVRISIDHYLGTPDFLLTVHAPAGGKVWAGRAEGDRT